MKINGKTKVVTETSVTYDKFDAAKVFANIYFAYIKRLHSTTHLEKLWYWIYRDFPYIYEFTFTLLLI